MENCNCKQYVTITDVDQSQFSNAFSNHRCERYSKSDHINDRLAIQDMGSLQQPGRYISSYANGSQRTGALQNQGGFPQSLSGSETDVSTSNENLSHEERYVIQHTARQEPQGQEQTSSQQHLQNSGNGGQQQQHQRQASRGSIKDGTTIPSNRSSLDVSSSSYNTLIIHGAGDEPWTGRLSGIRDRVDVNCSPLSFTSDKRRASSASPAPALSMGHQTGVTDINDIPDDYLSDSHVLKHLAKEVATKTPQQPSPNAASPAATRDSGVSENVDLDRLSIGGKGIITHSLDYEALRAKWRHRGASGKFPALSSLSKSQPDLSKVGGNGGSEATSGWRVRSGVSSAPRPRTRGREDGICGGDIWPQSEMVDILVQENGALKLDLENLYQKVAKTQKLEQEIAKVHRAHEDLAASCERRERLERAARSRLHADCRRLQELNAALREHADLLQAQLTAAQASVVGAGVQHEGDANVLRKEISRREILIAQLITQNKELVAAKERQEIELAAQRATLQEQRTHIDILDTALTNAQGNVVRLEEECRKKQMYVERVAQLQRALSSLQLASDRREQTERKLRLQLERELRSERARPGDDSQGLSLTGEASAAELKRRLRERDEKIMRLEGECAKWEQRYLEESALRQAAIDAASIPKDAKIAALEKTSQDAEKLIAEARSEKIRHMDEVHAAQKKVADLESKVKDYESKLAERDAMIRVLQKHAYDKDSGAVVGSRSPHHTPHASLHGAGTTATDLVLGTAVSREELVSSVLTGSTGFGSTTSYAGSSSGDSSSYGHHHHRGASSATKICHGLRYGSAATDADTAYDTTKRALDDQLKELDSQLDSQLLGKRGLCCFPGFASAAVAANAASQRKNKIPKPLLAAVGGNGGATGGGGSGSGGGGSQATSSAAGFLQGLVAVATSASSVSGGSSNKPEEMLLLEKQGRSSQQQRTVTGADATSASQRSSDGRKRDDRSGSLPPSSLPRPPRSTRSGISQPRKFGDYGRLQNDDTSSGGRKKSDGGDSISSGGSIGSSNNSKRQSPARSLIPPPRKLGEYGRLGGSSSPILRSKLPSQSQQQQQCMSARSSAGERDSASTLSDNSATSLPPPSKLRLYGGSPTGTTSRRGSSLGRDGNKTDSGSGSKFRIQF